MSNDLIKLAVAAEDQDQAERNLRFLSRLNLISVDLASLEAVLEDENSRPFFIVPGSGGVAFDDEWVRQNIVSAEIPQLVGVRTLASDQPFSGTVRLSREAMPAALAAFAEIELVGLKDLIVSFDSTFVPRTIRGTVSRLSAHALGIAFDLSCNWNTYGKPAPEIG